MSDFRIYLFSYRFDGAEWSFSVMARSAEEAKRRVAQMTFARYDGELVATIPAPLGWAAKLAVWLRNLLRPDGGKPCT